MFDNVNIVNIINIVKKLTQSCDIFEAIISNFRQWLTVSRKWDNQLNMKILDTISASKSLKVTFIPNGRKGKLNATDRRIKNSRLAAESESEPSIFHTMS